MSEQILFVDDDPNILSTYRRKFRQFRFDTAQEPEKALEYLRGEKPYAVVVADMQMPGMNGVQFLNHVRQTSPHTVRIMLTGNADQQTAMDAVNHGEIFRFLTKPCPTDIFTMAIIAGLEQHRLITAERELLQKTLRGSIKVLFDILAMLDPVAFGRAMVVKERVKDLAASLSLEKPWEVEIAAMLYPIAYITVPPQLRAKSQEQQFLTGQEKQVLAEALAASNKLLSNIPRLEPVGNILLRQEERFDGKDSGKDHDTPPIGARIIRALIDLGDMEASGKSTLEALRLMRKRKGLYDPDILDLMDSLVVKAPPPPPVSMPVSDLQDGYILAQDVTTDTGILLIRKGQAVTAAVKTSLKNYLALGHIAPTVMAIGLASDPEQSAA